MCDFKILLLIMFCCSCVLILEFSVLPWCSQCCPVTCGSLCSPDFVSVVLLSAVLCVVFMLSVLYRYSLCSLGVPGGIWVFLCCRGVSSVALVFLVLFWCSQ